MYFILLDVFVYFFCLFILFVFWGVIQFFSYQPFFFADIAQNIMCLWQNLLLLFNWKCKYKVYESTCCKSSISYREFRPDGKH